MHVTPADQHFRGDHDTHGSSSISMRFQAITQLLTLENQIIKLTASDVVSPELLPLRLFVAALQGPAIKREHNMFKLESKEG